MSSSTDDQQKFPLIPVVSITFFIMFGFGLVVPTLPLFASSFGVKEAGIGLLLTVFAAARLAASLFTGGILARFGERRVATAGALIVGASSFSAGFAPNFMSLVILRGFGGFGSAFFLGAVMSAMLGGVDAEHRGRALGAFQAAIVMGFVVGPAFGGLIGKVSLRAPLYAYGVICILAAPMLSVVLARVKGNGRALEESVAPTSEEALPPPRVRTWSTVRPLLSDSAYRAAVACAWASFFVVGGFDTLASRTWRFTLHQSQGSVGIPFMINALAGLPPTFHAGRVADRRGRKFTTVPALAVSVPLIVLLGRVHSPVPFAVLTGLLGIAWAYQRPGPSAIVGDVTDDSTRAAAVGFVRIANDVGALAGPIIVGAVAQSFGRPAGYVVVSLGVLVALAFMIPSRETHGARAKGVKPASGPSVPDTP